MRSFNAISRYSSALRRRPAIAALLLLTIAAACGDNSNPQTPPVFAAPTLIGTVPTDTATDVALNSKLSASFDMPMAALSGSTFTLKQGTNVIAGAVSASSDGTLAVYAPTANLLPATLYTATIAGGTKSVEGGSFAADQSWTFTTGTTADTTPPTVTSTTPSADRTGVATNAKVAATFSEAMDRQTLTAANFTVKQGTTAVAGTVTYGPGNTVTFTSTSPFAPSVLLTASVGTGAKDLQGNALAAAYSWNFTTGTTTSKGPAPVLLGTAGNFVALAKTGISSVPTSALTGDIGVSPAAATYITGFSLVADSTNVFATSTQITGRAFAANYAVPSPSNLTTAVGNMQAAYTDAAGRPTPDFLELGTGNIGGKTLAPGLYKWTSTVTIPTDVTISGGPNDVWIFQTTGDITMAAAKNVTLAGGALAKNIFWEVAGKVTIGANSHFEGIVLCKTQVTLQTGASMNGRILAQSAIVLQSATVVQPAP